MRLIILKHQLGRIYGWLPYETEEIDNVDVELLQTLIEIDDKKMKERMDEIKNKGGKYSS